MARLPRLTLPGYPHHIIQRGNNRQMIFADTQDFATMMALLAENAHKFAVAVHAYVLMDNHFHLLATPATAEALPLMMQAVGRSYVRYFNQRHARTGTLWEGRYRSTLIETERYLLACMVYIDLNPVRAGMVAQPGAWQWSSHAHYLGQRIDKLVTPHALYWALGNTPFAREAAYAGIGAGRHWHRGAPGGFDRRGIERLGVGRHRICSGVAKKIPTPRHQGQGWAASNHAKKLSQIGL
jgi:putative transposase